MVSLVSGMDAPVDRNRDRLVIARPRKVFASKSVKTELRQFWKELYFETFINQILTKENLRCTALFQKWTKNWRPGKLFTPRENWKQRKNHRREKTNKKKEEKGSHDFYCRLYGKRGTFLVIRQQSQQNWSGRRLQVEALNYSYNTFFRLLKFWRLIPN